MKTIRVFAPATIANLGPGFDVLGLAVAGDGDIVEVRQLDGPDIAIEHISGDGGQLTLDPTKNTAGVAAAHALKIIGTDKGVAIKLYKGMPLGSGLGSSAASAAAAAWAVACLGGFQDKEALLPACLAAEAAVSGYHADNVAPSLLGGLILISGYHPLKIRSIPTPPNLFLVLVTPDYEIPTAKARAVVPKVVSLERVIANSGQLGEMIAASYEGDVAAVGRGIVDEIIEPARAHLIPGFDRVKQASLEAGAFGCSISGAGPTIFAITDSHEKGDMISRAMRQAFQSASLASVARVVQVDTVGARQID